jgi:hypothetical protein
MKIKNEKLNTKNENENGNKNKYVKQNLYEERITNI